MNNIDYVILEDKRDGKLCMAKISPYMDDLFVIWDGIDIKRIEGPHHYILTEVIKFGSGEGVRLYSNYEVYDLEPEFADVYYSILREVHVHESPCTGKIIHLELNKDGDPVTYSELEF